MTTSLRDPPNGGYGWVVVFATHLSMIIAGGILTSLGMFLPKLMDQFEDATEAIVSLVTSLCLGIALGSGPLTSQLMLHFGCRKLVMTGGFLAMCGFLVTALSNSVMQLAIGIGIVAGAGLGLVVTPSLAIVSSYFTTKYAIAHGITNAGIGVGGTIFPLLFDWLIGLYGWRGAALITGGICLQMCWCGALIRPILSHDEESNKLITTSQASQIQTPHLTTRRNIMDTVITLIRKQVTFFVRYPLLLLVGSATTCYFVSFLNFQLFLPKVVEDLGYSSNKAAITLTAVGVASTIGRVSYWILLSINGMTPTLLMLLSTVVTGLPLVCFPLFNTYQVIILSSVIFGLGSGSAGALIIVTLKEVVQTQQHHVIAIGWQFLFQGISQIVGGYLGGLLGELTGDYQLTILLGGILDVFAVILLSVLYLKLRMHKKDQNTVNLM